MNFPVRTPRLFQWLLPKLLWHMPRDQKRIYLTFDDGPHPDITLEVLSLLADHQAKATFFCVGENVSRYPHIVQATHAAGHTLGNHTFHHLNGWKTDGPTYLQDIHLADQAFQSAIQTPIQLFRPPYGKPHLTSLPKIRQAHQVVMWDIVAGDFVQDWPTPKVTHNVLHQAGPGSIVVLHDSEKCHAKMIPTLRQTLTHFSNQGYTFSPLPSNS